MNSDRVSENLQTIRTLMERSAVYRRALGPIMMAVGGLGIAAAVAGSLLRIASAPHFIVYWMSVALAALAISFLLSRREALRTKETFWSPPTKRVAQAMSLPLFVGAVMGIVVLILATRQSGVLATATAGDATPLIWLPATWAIIYGLALHAAGFFASRGLRLLGWLFVFFGISFGCITLFVPRPEHSTIHWAIAHAIMGVFFGGFHLACGIYLQSTREAQKES